MQNKVFSLLGLATKAGETGSGEFVTENAVKKGKAFLVIVATDASANTKKQFDDMCRFYEVPVSHYGTKEELGKAIGKEMRASVVIYNEGFAKSMIKLLNKSEVVE